MEMEKDVREHRQGAVPGIVGRAVPEDGVPDLALPEEGEERFLGGFCHGPPGLSADHATMNDSGSCHSPFSSRQMRVLSTRIWPASARTTRSACSGRGAGR